MTNLPRPGIATLICPQCKQEATLKTIIYGMPNINFDFKKYAIGGCEIAEGQPEIKCTACTWRGLRKDLLEVNP